MQILKDWAHRNRWVASTVDWVHWRTHQHRFAKHLAASVGEAVQWRSRGEVSACLKASLQSLPRSDTGPRRKGSPSRYEICGPDLASLQHAVAHQDYVVSADEVRAAGRIASLDPANPHAFRLYLAVMWLRHERLIGELRSRMRERIIVHISCLPRLSRAHSSIESFAVFNRADTGHLRLVGHAEENTFDSEASVLHVTAPDNYEGLPRKTFEGLGLLALACNPASVVKLDDDHRLNDAAALGSLIDFAARSRGAVQIGEVNRASLPSAHHRAWHFGKCTSPELNDQILAYPAPRRWAAGSAGYILNRAALWRMLWASLYYDRWLGEILYEDLAVAEVANKTGIRVVNAAMRRAITAVPDY